jgi:TolB protein
MSPHPRSRRYLLVWVLTLGVLLLLPTAAAAVVPADGGSLPGAETRISTSIGDEYDPALSGNLISYTSYRGVDTDMWYYDLASGLETQVTSAVGNQELSDVRDGLIVYTDLETLDIMLYDPATALTTNLTPERPVSINPCIGDGIVAWEDVSQGSQEIFARHLATGELRQASNSPCCVDAKPASDGETIVWESCSGTCAVRAYDWATGTTKTLASATDCDFRRPDVSGETVVFDGLVSGDRDIYAYDLASDTLTRLELFGVQVNANVSGDHVCFEDLSVGISHCWVWDLTNDTVYRATTGPGGQFLNDIEGNRIVYGDDRDGQLDIYTYEFDLQPPTITVNGPLEGAVLTEYDVPPAADWSATDDYSGVASSGGTLASGEPLDMTPGIHTLTFWAEDAFGNRSSVERTYVVRDVGISFAPAPGETLPFGDVTVGQAVTQIVTATNTGEVPLWVNGATAAGSSSAFSVSGGGALLDPGQTLDLAVRFAPLGTGVQSGALHLEAGDAVTHSAYPLGLADIALTGRGVSAELPPDQAAQNLLAHFNAAIADGTLVGTGGSFAAAIHVKAMRCMIEASGDYIARGHNTLARILLTLVVGSCDGVGPDLVKGTSRQQICDEARALLRSIGG